MGMLLSQGKRRRKQQLPHSTIIRAKMPLRGLDSRAGDMTVRNLRLRAYCKAQRETLESWNGWHESASESACGQVMPLLNIAKHWKSWEALVVQV